MKTRQEKELIAKTIVEASDLLAKVGWSIAIPEKDDVDHILVGEIEALEDLVFDLDEEYTVMSKEGH
jgi:hypothetical protein